jgi:hypothetical protein
MLEIKNLQQAKSILIIAVMHQKQHPDSWRVRVDK